MLTTKNILVVLVFSMIMRAFVEIVCASYVGKNNSFFLDLFAQGGMYILMASLIHIVFRKELPEIISYFRWHSPPNQFFYAILLAFLLLAFSFGENAIEVLVFSNIDADFAYSFWNFHERYNKVYPVWSSRVIFYILITSILAPIIEEFIFRVLLLKTLASKYGVVKAIIIGSLLFTLLHYSSHYFISTFLFSLFLYVIYLIYGSFLFCVLIHAIYNTLSFFEQYYFDIHWVKNIQEITSIEAWWPQLMMLVISTIAFIFLGKRKNGILKDKIKMFR